MQRATLIVNGYSVVEVAIIDDSDTAARDAIYAAIDRVIDGSFPSHISDPARPFQLAELRVTDVGAGSISAERR